MSVLNLVAVVVEHPEEFLTACQALLVPGVEVEPVHTLGLVVVAGASCALAMTSPGVVVVAMAEACQWVAPGVGAWIVVSSVGATERVALVAWEMMTVVVARVTAGTLVVVQAWTMLTTYLQ